MNELKPTRGFGGKSTTFYRIDNGFNEKSYFCSLFRIWYHG